MRTFRRRGRDTQAGKGRLFDQLRDSVAGVYLFFLAPIVVGVAFETTSLG
jgi:hypothetical protein